MSTWNYSSRGYDSTSDDECDDGYPFTTGIIRRNGPMATSFHREQSMTSLMNYSSNSIEHYSDNDNDSGDYYDDDNDDDNSSIGCNSTVSTISGKSYASNITFNSITNIIIPNNIGLVNSSSTTTTMRRCSSVGNSTIPPITDSNNNFSSSNNCNYVYNSTCTTVPSIPTPIRFLASSGGTTTTCQPPLSSVPMGKLMKQRQNKNENQQPKRRKKKIQPPSKNTSLYINVILLLVSIVCILTPFYFALVYALPKSSIGNSTNTTTTTTGSTAVTTIAASTGSSTLASIGQGTITYNNNNITIAESKIYDSIHRMNSMKITKTTVSSTEIERKDREFLRSRERRHRFLRWNNKTLI